MQVLQHEHDGCVCGERLETDDHLAEHARPCHAGMLPLQGLAVGGGDETGKLQQPGRRVLAEERHEVTTDRPATEAFQALQDGHEGFAGPVLLHALPAGHPEDPSRRDTFQERFHERGLPDARIPGHEDDLTLASEGILQVPAELLELPVAPDDRAASARRQLAPSARDVDGRDEAIPASVDGLDEPRGLRAVAQDFAQLAHADRKDHLAHGEARPDRGKQLVLGHQAVRPLRQVVQDCEGPGPERHDLVATRHAPLDHVEDEGGKTDRRGERLEVVLLPRHSGSICRLFPRGI